MTLPLATSLRPSTRAPVRISLALPSGRLTYRRLKVRLRACGDRVELVGRGTPHRANLVLFDPCAGGRSLDMSRLGEAVAGQQRVVVYTSAPAVDPLAFAMAGSLMDGRLRGWLSQDLSADDLAHALERIHLGEIVVEGAPA
jgi:hypothetical protein